MTEREPLQPTTPQAAGMGAGDDLALAELVGRLAGRVEELLGWLREKPAQDEHLLAQVSALRAEQTVVATSLSALQRFAGELRQQVDTNQRTAETVAAVERRVESLEGQSETVRLLEARIEALQQRVDELSQPPTPAVADPAEPLLALQRRVNEMSRQEDAVSDAVRALTERIRLLVPGERGPALASMTEAERELRIPVTPLPAAPDSVEPDAPLQVRIGAVPSKKQAERLGEAIARLPSVARIAQSEFASGTASYTVQLRDSWPRASFTRQLSWLEGLRLSLVFNGPDGLHADLVSGPSPHKRRIPRLWPFGRRTSSAPALQTHGGPSSG